MGAPLSPFYRTGNLIYISGQVGSDIDTHSIPEDFDLQVINTFKNLQLVLDDAGANKNAIVKVTVFMTDLSKFARMNELYAEYFGSHKPARTTIGVAALPEFLDDPEVFIEVEAVAEIVAKE